MKHKIGFNPLERRTGHRKALIRNMLISLFRYERIKTTKAKAMQIRRTAEKMITRAKTDSVHNRRIIAKKIHDEEVLAKLFTTIGPRFSARPGGYTRVFRIGRRLGDASEMVLLELLDRTVKEKKKKEKKEKKEDKKDEKTEAKEQASVQA
jgi:large subunit ribosomal protein L17